MKNLICLLVACIPFILGSTCTGKDNCGYDTGKKVNLSFSISDFTNTYTLRSLKHASFELNSNSVIIQYANQDAVFTLHYDLEIRGNRAQNDTLLDSTAFGNHSEENEFCVFTDFNYIRILQIPDVLLTLTGADSSGTPMNIKTDSFSYIYPPNNTSDFRRNLSDLKYYEFSNVSLSTTNDTIISIYMTTPLSEIGKQYGLTVDVTTKE